MINKNSLAMNCSDSGIIKKNYGKYCSKSVFHIKNLKLNSAKQTKFL